MEKELRVRCVSLLQTILAVFFIYFFNHNKEFFYNNMKPVRAEQHDVSQQRESRLLHKLFSQLEYHFYFKPLYSCIQNSCMRQPVYSLLQIYSHTYMQFSAVQGQPLLQRILIKYFSFIFISFWSTNQKFK